MQVLHKSARGARYGCVDCWLAMAMGSQKFAAGRNGCGKEMA